MVRLHAWVSGRVQGVFFRDFTRQQAADHGLAGWVRNLEDGRVEAVFEGDRAAVASVLERLRQGPPRARVDGIDQREEEPEGLDGFSVLG